MTGLKAIFQVKITRMRRLASRIHHVKETPFDGGKAELIWYKAAFNRFSGSLAIAVNDGSERAYQLIPADFVYPPDEWDRLIQWAKIFCEEETPYTAKIYRAAFLSHRTDPAGKGGYGCLSCKIKRNM